MHKQEIYPWHLKPGDWILYPETGAIAQFVGYEQSKMMAPSSIDGLPPYKLTDYYRVRYEDGSEEDVWEYDPIVSLSQPEYDLIQATKGI